ncbi:MAG: hypothetical protein QMC81_03905 [Thermoanaerobacterales bacterium]|nr:hypothetical protein [Bacillota bacterium]MDI6906625.1 hypothetical protein [Thermoanaerobacterales bacterium]
MPAFLGGLLGTLHVLSAVAWVGSVIYHFVAVRPALRLLGEGRALGMEARTAARYTMVTWVSLGLLAITGFIAVATHWAALSPLLARPAGLVLLLKLALVAVLSGIFLLQTYGYDPFARRVFRASQDAFNPPRIREAAADRNTLFIIYIVTGVLVIALSVALSGLLRPGG